MSKRYRKTRDRRNGVETQSKRGDKNSKLKYDDRGIHIKSGKDMCDCLLLNCPGCFLPCPECKSQKCGQGCRINRTWEYEAHTIDGYIRYVIENRYRT